MDQNTPLAALLAQARAKGKKKISKKALSKAAQILGAAGGHRRAYLQDLKKLSRIGKYGAAIRWNIINKETTPWASYDVEPPAKKPAKKPSKKPSKK